MQPRRWADVPDSMNWASEQQRLTLGQDDYSVGPMGPEASTPAPRRVSQEGLFNLDISPIPSPVQRMHRHEIRRVCCRPRVQRQLFGDTNDEQNEPQSYQRSNRLPMQPMYGPPGSSVDRPVDPSAVVPPPGMERPCPIRRLPPVFPLQERRRQPKNYGTESKLFRECVLPLPRTIKERVHIDNRLRTSPLPAAQHPLNISGDSDSSDFGGIMGLPGSPIEQDAPHRQLLQRVTEVKITNTVTDVYDS